MRQNNNILSMINYTYMITYQILNNALPNKVLRNGNLFNTNLILNSAPKLANPKQLFIYFIISIKYTIKTGENTKNSLSDVNAAIATNINDNADKPINTNLIIIER